jgi:VWFA-related protein
MIKVQKLLTVAVLVALFCTNIGAQSESGASTPTIRINTHLVLVDVVATDKHGKAITDLKASDFTLQEKGKSEKIAIFNPPGSQDKGAARGLGPGIYSNRPEYVTTEGPLAVLLLDTVNTSFRDSAYARRQMLQFVRNQYKPGQRMAIFTLSNGLAVLQDFTTDPQLLYNALVQYLPKEQEGKAAAAPAVANVANADSGRGNSNSMADSFNQRIQAFQNAQVAYQEDRRIEITLAAMRSLARILAGVPGRKSVLWVTAGFPFSLIPEDRTISDTELAESLPTISQLSLGTRDSGSVASITRQGHAGEIRLAAAQLASAQIAIYPVDARGLVSGMEETMLDPKSRNLDAMTQGAQARISNVTSTQETMREMARETGGKAYINQNEVQQGVALALADYPASYTLGYYPDDKKWDGKYRSIKVKTQRDGVELRYRRGYFAIDTSQLKDQKPEQAIAEALSDQAANTLVTFLAQVKPGDKGKLGVDILVDSNSVTAEDVAGGNKKLNLVFYAAIFSADGKMLGNQSMKIDQTFDANTFQQVQQHGILTHMDIDPKPGKNDLRIAVRDNHSASVGTLIVPLQ